ncbi:MAG TPA: multicopper oxidase domain-containing protein [Baekduia sp.]
MTLSRRDLLCRLGMGSMAVAAGGGGAVATAAAGPGARAAQAPSAAAGPTVREYWVAARNVRWKIVPTGRDAWKRKAIKNVTYDALAYVACTPNWEQPLPPGGVGDNAGIPGPVLRGYPGDTLRVHFRNEDKTYNMPHTMHPHGVGYTPDHDGTYMGLSTRPSGAVPVGKTWTYEWDVRNDSIGVWPYHDHGPMEMMSTNLGLFGAIVIRPREEPPPDVEHTIYFHMYMPADVKARKAFSAINGRAYAGNTPTPAARVGQDVAFNVLTLGNELHTFHIHGHRWKDPAGAWVDAPDLSPSQGIRVRYVEDAPGRWLYHCHVMSHMEQGMVGFYDVSP